MRKKIIAGNWKMNTTLADAHVLADGVRQELEHVENIIVVLFPPLIWLTELAHNLPVRSQPHLKLGSQNISSEEWGAFTGETSALMVKEVAEYTLIGHSERTHLFNEKIDALNMKLHAAFKAGLTPMLCIGEDEQNEQSTSSLRQSLRNLLKGLEHKQLQKLVVAYEPVWAIGTGKAATSTYAQNIAAALRHELTEETHILYGGSVNDQNAKEFLQQPDIDGLLIGGVSLKLKQFVTICQVADNLR